MATLSVVLEALLCHTAEKDAVPMSLNGWVDLDDVVTWVNIRHFECTKDDVMQVLSDEENSDIRILDDGRTEVRAIRGHTIAKVIVDITELTLGTAPNLAVHRTSSYSMFQYGLSGGASRILCMTRLRKSDPLYTARKAVLVYVDIHAAIREGMRFFEREGLILTDGFDGRVPPEFFVRVVDCRTGRLLA